MSYQVLARKWRPYQFSQVVGQAHVLKALSNALEHNRVHHAYLFSGTRGVGKTTIARIFAKGLNCEQGVSSSPCGQCVTCQEIEQGRCVDLLEIDAASRTKVEDTRELLDNVQYKPARCRYKIYLIDEVHMLSRHSFNALLKTLEEPPEYVKFILATTDPQKLPITILSRCLQFNLKHLQPEQIQTQLSHVLTEEHLSFEPQALALLAHAADGSMRDALSLTDQAIALGGGEVKHELVATMLGAINTEQALRLIETLVGMNAKAVFDKVAEFAYEGIEWDSLLSEVIQQFHRIAMAQVLAQSVDSNALDAKLVLNLAEQLSPQDVQLFYQIALQGRQDLPFASNAKSGFEMVLLRILAFKPTKVAPVPIDSEDQSEALTPSIKQNQVNARAQENRQETILTPKTEPVSAVLTMPTQIVTKEPQTQQVSAQESLAQGLPKPALNSLVAARRMLKNQQKQHQASYQKEQTNSAKKPESALSISSTFKTQTPSNVVTRSNIRTQNQVPEAYRWQSTQSQIDSVEPSITPEKIKNLISHERSKEMREKLAQEAAKCDEWSRIIGELALSQMARLLALNAAMEKNGKEITLFFRQSQAHLNTEKINTELEQALSEYMQETILLNLILDEHKGVAPLEWRDKLYTEKMAQAVKSLNADTNIAFMRQRFAASLDEDSIRPI